jgi:F-type H+-transporting ATPase subunit b
MRIDWWTLALQTVNVLILIWLLARFLFRPVADIVARRQEAANKLLADAAEVQRQAEAARADLEHARANIVAGREKVIAEAHSATESERLALLARTNEEITNLRAQADAAISRDRIAMEKTLIERTRELSVEIARRLLERVSPMVATEAFLAGLCHQVRALPPRERRSFMPTEADSIDIVTASPLSAEETERIERAIAEAFAGKRAFAFRSDPAVIAGIELHSRHGVIRNSWQSDLERIGRELKRVEEPTRQSR